MSMVYAGVSVWIVQRLAAPTVPPRSAHADDAAAVVVGAEDVVAAEDVEVVGGVVMASEDGPGLLELPQAAAPTTTVAPTSAMRTLRVVTGCSDQPRWTISR